MRVVVLGGGRIGRFIARDLVERGHIVVVLEREPGRCEELVAELGAVLLGDRLEIGSAMANHAAYLGHWIKLLKESPRVLLQVLSDARKAADLVCPESGGE